MNMATMEYTTRSKIPVSVPSKDEFEEIQGEQLIQFTKEGETVSGKVLFVREGMVREQKVMELGLRTTTGNVKMFMNHDLRSKILTEDVGRVVVIIFDSLEDTGKETPMKIFRVFRRKVNSTAQVPRQQNAPTPVTGDPGITDDDIPF
jgi:hypothetical protein